MADLPRRSDIFRRGRAAAIAVPNTRITADAIDTEGSDLNLVLNAGAVMGEQIVNRLANAIQNAYINTATGRGLDRVVVDRLGLPRIEAAPAVVDIQLSRPTFAAGSGTVIGGLPGGSNTPTRISNNRGIVYFLTQTATFGATDLGPITVRAQAQIAGFANQVGANQSWTFVDPPFDPTITIANPVTAAGAGEEETDEKYKIRARNFLPTIRRGIAAAILFGLESTPGVATASVIEVTSAGGLPACLGQAFVLDELGQSNAGLAARAQDRLLEFRALGIPVQVGSGLASFQSIAISLTFDTALVEDTVQAAEDVKSAIIAALNALRPGQTLQRSFILAAARSVLGVEIADTALTVPAGDLLPASNDIAFRTRRDLITT